MTPNAQDTQSARPSQAEFQELLREKMRAAIRMTLACAVVSRVTAVG